MPEPFVEVHPKDAADAGLADGGFAELTNHHGRVVVKVSVTEGQRRGSVFVPIHWSDNNSSDARVGALVASRADPFSGQPEAKATPVSIASVAFASQGFVLSRDPITIPNGLWWTRVTLPGGYGYLCAGNEAAAWDAMMMGVDGEIAEYRDLTRGIRRAAIYRNDKLLRCLFIGPASAPPSWDAVKTLFARETLNEVERRVLLSGRGPAGPDRGPIVCACFGVGRQAIEATIAAGAATSDAIGAALKAGTNCGSCVPELKRLIADSMTPAAIPG